MWPLSSPKISLSSVRQFSFTVSREWGRIGAEFGKIGEITANCHFTLARLLAVFVGRCAGVGSFVTLQDLSDDQLKETSVGTILVHLSTGVFSCDFNTILAAEKGQINKFFSSGQ